MHGWICSYRSPKPNGHTVEALGYFPSRGFMYNEFLATRPRYRGVKKKIQVQQQEPEEFLALASTSPTWSPREYSADGP